MNEFERVKQQLEVIRAAVPIDPKVGAALYIIEETVKQLVSELTVKRAELDYLLAADDKSTVPLALCRVCESVPADNDGLCDGCRAAIIRERGK